MLVESVVEPACPVLTPKYHLLTLLVADSSHTVGWHGEWQRAAFSFSSWEHPQHAPKFTFSGKVTAPCWSGAAGVSNGPGESDDPGESEMGMTSERRKTVAFCGFLGGRGGGFLCIRVLYSIFFLSFFLS
jgi:hypothetical protein